MRTFRNALVGLLLILIPLGACTKSTSTSNSSTTTGDKKAPVSDAMDITYASFSAAVYDNKLAGSQRGVNYSVPVAIGVSTMAPMQSFVVANIQITQTPQKGSVIVVGPQHTILSDQSCHDYYYNQYDCNDGSYEFPYGKGQDAGNEINFPIKDGTNFSDEINSSGGTVNFSILVEGIATFDYEQVMNTLGSYTTSKMLQYANISASDINLSAEFDLVATFADGSQATKHYALTVGTGQLIETGWFTGTLTEL